MTRSEARRTAKTESAERTALWWVVKAPQAPGGYLPTFAVTPPHSFDIVDVYSNGKRMP